MSPDLKSLRLGQWIIPEWPAPTNVRALVTTRGTGGDTYGDCNLALHVGDDPPRVKANRAQLQRQFGAESIQWLQQVHGTRVVEVVGSGIDEPNADGLYSAAAGIALAVMTADCLPVLFCDRQGTAIAAAHAGWRGLAKGILADTIACFDQPAGELMAWLGPAIGPCHFEVGAEVRAAFYDNPQFAGVEQLAGAFVPSPQAGHYFCDLYALARHGLKLGGLEHVYGGDFCTYRDASLFYSYRRQGVCGRMATIIMRQ
jgi:YfiH family protein